MFEKLINQPKHLIDSKLEFSEFVPDDFKNHPFEYFEQKGVNIKSGEIKYKETGEISDDPTAVKELPEWKNSTGNTLNVIAKRVNIEKSQVRHSGDPFYEYHIMELANELDLPCVEPIAKIESEGQFMFLTKKTNGITRLDDYIKHLQENGWSQGDILSIKNQAEEMMNKIKEQYDAVGIMRKWELKDMVCNIDFEKKSIISATPTDFEKTKIDHPKFFEAREKKIKSK